MKRLRALSFLMVAFQMSSQCLAEGESYQGGGAIAGVFGFLLGLPELGKSSGFADTNAHTTISGRCSMKMADLNIRACPLMQLTLVDATGKPVQTTWTDTQGIFRFLAIPKGEFSIEPGISNFEIANNGKLIPGHPVEMRINE